ncbi:hypothetical protein NC653_032694 [Populus alba x Populus x berolinensis]|uniref:Uncharacterized protein n=1 Tax=Populus alba x Populus x berolinensis TaxID=444605 RepID=A0AAD6Q036_9ROSI|nr:hypothetical protein NC653_032694 [Populus alba x Populus x berolinensis]
MPITRTASGSYILGCKSAPHSIMGGNLLAFHVMMSLLNKMLLVLTGRGSPAPGSRREFVFLHLHH